MYDSFINAFVFASSICVVSALFVIHLGPDVGWELRLIIMVCGNMFLEMSFMRYVTCWGRLLCVCIRWMVLVADHRE